MPITKDRIKALLAAAEDGLEAQAKAIKIVRGAIARHRTEGTDPVNVLAELEIMFEAPLLAEPLKTPLAIEREREHWTPARERENERKKKALRVKRGSGGLEHD